MKNFFLSLMLFISIPYIHAHDQNTAPARLTITEVNYLNDLHKCYNQNSSFYQSCHANTIAKDIDFLEKRIEWTKYYLIPKNNWKKRMELFYISLIPIAILAGGIIAIIYEHKEFLMKRFGIITIPSSLVKNVSEVQFKPKERRYLKQFKVEKITAHDYSPYNFSYAWDIPTNWESIINNLSTRNKEKLTYAAINYAIKSHRQKIWSKITHPFTVYMGLWLSFMVYFIIDYPRILDNQLKKDLELHNILKKHQASL